MAGVVTVTEIETFDRCGWRWDFNSKNRLGLESANPLNSLRTGTLWHKTLDSLSQRELMADPSHKFEGEPGKACDICSYDQLSHTKDPLGAHAYMLRSELIAHYESIVGRYPSSKELKPTEDAIAMCRAMLDNYMAYYGGRILPVDFVFIQPEQQLYSTLPNTNHCTCYSKSSCECGQKCRLKHSHYTYCKCADTACICRQDITLEGTLDALILHQPTQNIYVWENKTFSVHTYYDELKRLSQFMGYSWLGRTLDVKGVIYNGAWTRVKVPDGKKMSDMFIRHILPFTSTEIHEWETQAAQKALIMCDPKYVTTRTVHPVGGCNGVNGCDFKKLCDARFSNQNYESILTHEFRPREATGKTAHVG